MLEILNTDLIIFGTSFLFVFAIVYALLAYSKIFQDNRYASAMIAVVFGIIAAIYEPFAFFIQNFLPYAAMALVVIFFFIFVKSIFGGGKDGGSKEAKDYVPALVVLAVMIVLLAATWPIISQWIGMTVSMSETILWIIGIVVVLAIFLAAYKMQIQKPG